MGTAAAHAPKQARETHVKMCVWGAGGGGGEDNVT